MSQKDYAYLQIEIKEDSTNAIVIVSGDYYLVTTVKTTFSGAPDIQTTSKVLARAMELTLTSDKFSAHLLKMGVISLFSDLEVVPNSMFVDLANGTEKMMLYRAKSHK